MLFYNQHIFLVVQSPSCAWLLCPSSFPGICPNSCPVNQWCHPNISSSVTLFSFCLQSFPESGTFPMSQLIASGDQLFELKLQHQSFWRVFSVDWFDLLAFQGIHKSLLQHHISNASILWCSAFFIVQLSHLYLSTGKTIALTTWSFGSKVISLLFCLFVCLFVCF